MGVASEDFSVEETAKSVAIAVVFGVLASVAISWAVIKLRYWQLGARKPGDVLCGYVLGEVLGKGGFGEVRRATNLWGNLVAVKVPHEGREGRVGREVSMMKRLNPPPTYSEAGFPSLLWTDGHVIMMSLLGPSLEHIKRVMPNKVFSLKTVLLIAGQAVQLIRRVHYKRAVHRDIKPENFLVGLGPKKTQLHLVDYGLSERFYCKRAHIPFREGRTVYGTPYFSSTNADAGFEQSRRDDLEGLAYVLIYLVQGTLPWIGLKSLGPLNTWHSRVSAMKIDLQPAALCEGLPPEFSKLLQYAKELKFTETPDYDYLSGMFHRRYAKLGYLAEDDDFDWVHYGKDWACWKLGGSPGSVDPDRE
ncbi:Casein kinase I-like protein hhp1 [Diplonema papillatum]|nr:Casein kinase I-like protein hhp1 [Diplonema papillatum]